MVPLPVTQSRLGMGWAVAALVVTMATLAGAHPEKLICKDPRLLEGGMMMHNYIVSNQYSEGLILTASATSYSPGSEVVLTMRANGSKFVTDSAPKGVFLALQSRSACTLEGDHGNFSAASADLARTTDCDSGVFSRTADGKFTGLSTATWIAGPRTTGNVTFTLLWSNGPGATDPLSVKGAVRVPDSYLFMKSLTLSGPPGPCPPPVPVPAPPAPGSPDKCVWSSSKAGVCPLAGVQSPVFIQDLGEEGLVTFPSGRCLPCRIDHRGTCRSARVTCPATPGASVEEHIWAASKDCDGAPTRIGYLKDSEAYCPGRQYYSVDKLDLSRFIPKLVRDHGQHVKDEATATAAVEEYRRMLLLIQKFPEKSVVPSKLVDLVWHEHILDTAQYRRDCLRMFGRYIHHNPSFGGDEEKVELESQQAQMFHLYKDTFDVPPPLSIWPTARRHRLGGNNGALPDCCSALCVKAACHDCVGCNSVDCGHLGEGEKHGAKGASRQQFSPEAFAGYVPAHDPSRDPQVEDCYLCRLDWAGAPAGSPYTMSVEWTIAGEYIYFRQSLVGLSAWYSLGFSGQAPFDMGFSDYMLSMMTRNYTGVKDLYKFDTGNGYPCFDVLHECSVGNKTQGTKDVEQDVITRENGVTQSTWSRKLTTPDPKDWPITRDTMTVLLAHGTEDYFTYHQKHFGTCHVNFFDGSTDCGVTAQRDDVVV